MAPRTLSIHGPTSIRDDEVEILTAHRRNSKRLSEVYLSDLGHSDYQVEKPNLERLILIRSLTVLCVLAILGAAVVIRFTTVPGNIEDTDSFEDFSVSVPVSESSTESSALSDNPIQYEQFRNMIFGKYL